jgi:molecular chaperone DnaJ
VLRGGRFGDLRVVVNVVIPKHLTKAQKELMERLAESLTEHNLRTEHGVFQKLKRAFGG